MMKYRAAKASDVNGVAEVLLENFNVTDLKHAKIVFKQEIAKKHVFIVAEKGKRIVGVCSWYKRGLFRHGLARIERMAVHPEFAGQGIGSELFRRALQDIDKLYKKNGAKLRKVYASMHSSNKKARKFYKCLGFVKEATLKDHYYKGEDECIYSIFLE